MKVNWKGVIPAITTPYNGDLSIDQGFLTPSIRAGSSTRARSAWFPLARSGESATLSAAEKRQVMETCVKAVGDRVPIIPGIAALSTAEAVALARDAKAIGCSGLMVLPPYVYSTDWREMKAHVRAVISQTDLPCMLYNNPIAYKTDFLPQQIVELAAELPNLHAVKEESSADLRRVMAIRALADVRVQILRSVSTTPSSRRSDAGAIGWIAGLVNAFPAESVALYRYAMEGRRAEAFALYKWFLPLLRTDTVVKFVQLIKLAQQRVGMGSDRVRPPRLALQGDELREATALIDRALATRPSVKSGVSTGTP